MRAFTAGAWAWVVTGAGHLSIAAAMQLSAETPDGVRAADAMRAYRLELPGLSRSLYDVNNGMSLVMGTALVFAGVLCLMVARSAPQAVTRSLRVVCLLASLIVLGLAAWLLPLPPVVLFTVASVAFAVSLMRPPAAR